MHPTKTAVFKFFPTLTLLVILGVVFFSFQPTLQGQFLNWGDESNVLNNPALQRLNQQRFFSVFTTTTDNIYTPATTLSWSLEKRWFGLNPFYYRLNNLLLHMLVVLCVFYFAKNFGLSFYAAGIVSLIFGIHPVHVESVAWITQRKDVLYSFFYLLALIFYLSHVHKVCLVEADKAKRSGMTGIILTTFFGVLSILAHPMALSLPLILGLIDWYKQRKINKSVLIEKIPLLVFAVILAVMNFISYIRIPSGNILDGLLTWVWTFTFYLRQVLFPFMLLPVYRRPEPLSISQPEYFLSCLVFVLIVVGIVKLRSHRGIVFSLLLYFLSIFFLFRFDNASSVHFVADRFVYLPILGFCLFFGFIFDGLSGVAKQRKRRIGQGVFLACMLGFTIFSGFKTHQQTRVWNNSFSLWTYQLKFTPDEPVALANLADFLSTQQEYIDAQRELRKINELKNQGLQLTMNAKALADINKVSYLLSLLNRAVKLDPTFIEAHRNLGRAYALIGLNDSAVYHYKQIARLDPLNEETHLAMGDLFLSNNDPNRAVSAYAQALQANPGEDTYVYIIRSYVNHLKKDSDNQRLKEEIYVLLNKLTEDINKKGGQATSFFNLGFLYGEMGDLTRAISAYQMALDINPQHAKVLYNLGNAYKDLGKHKEALMTYEKAAQVDPHNSDIYINMGVINHREGKIKDAEFYYKKALEVDPKNSKAYFNLGFIQETAGKMRDAIDYYIQSTEADPRNAEAYYNLGNVYMKLELYQKAVEQYLAAIKNNPVHLNAHVNLSISYFSKQDFANAIKYCDEAILLGFDAPKQYLDVLSPHRN